MTDHFRIVGTNWTDATVTVNGEPFPYEVIGARWKFDGKGNSFPVLTLDIRPDRLTIEHGHQLIHD